MFLTSLEVVQMSQATYNPETGNVEILIYSNIIVINTWNEAWEMTKWEPQTPTYMEMVTP